MGSLANTLNRALYNLGTTGVIRYTKPSESGKSASLTFNGIELRTGVFGSVVVVEFWQSNVLVEGLVIADEHGDEITTANRLVSVIRGYLEFGEPVHV